ncbi:MAG: methyl-accepting chemotaxis protein [Candidatus Pelethousia sp.]|nr:methyl-accepting chemotaxis protein [Candidatus Pelethousia sp.]
MGDEANHPSFYGTLYLDTFPKNIIRRMKVSMKWFRNLKIGVKITVGFLLVAIIAGLIGVVGIVSLNRVGGSYSVAYADSVTALDCMEGVSSSFQEMRTDLFEMTLAKDKADKEACVEALHGHKAIIDENLAVYRAALTKYKAEEVEQELNLISALETAIDLFYGGSQDFAGGIALDSNRHLEAFQILSDGGELHGLAQETEGAISDLVEYNEEYTAQQIETNEKLGTSSVVIMIAGVLIGVLLAVLVGLLIASMISKPLHQMVEAADKLSQGNFDVNIKADSKDETGMLANSFGHMADTLKTIIADLTRGLEAFADGNFALDSQAQESYVGDYAPLLDSIRKMRDNLSDTLRHINMASEQVATGSNQVSSGAQALAAGSTEQAASVQQLSASIERIAEQAEQNSSTVVIASESVQQAGVGVNAGNEHMEQLTQAMTDIGSSSNQIANITKVIEDIAFQTNILALNAAIEAARAGDAGKGFAVVADEVRNLAAKSAEAAKQTGDLIQTSVDTVARGTEITNQTAQILKEVGASAAEVIDSFGKIEQSIAEQTAAIEQIKQGITQISAVVQTNAATAEENSATSEEMSAQAATLRHEVGKFKLLAGN